MLEIVLLTGLPGSGKTMFTYSKWPETSYLDWLPDSKYRKVVHTDDFLKGESAKKLSDIDWTEFGIDPYYTDYTVIVDGFFPTKDMRKEVIKAILLQVISKYRSTYLEDSLSWSMVEYWWKPNVTRCLTNDLHRPRLNSAHTIKNTIMEEPLTMDDIKDLYDSEAQLCLAIDTIFKDVEDWYGNPLNTIANINYNTYCTNKDDPTYIYSRWYTDMEDFGMNGFEELDEILEKMNPNITYLEYKKLSKEIKVDRDHVHDYYESYDKCRYKISKDILKKFI